MSKCQGLGFVDDIDERQLIDPNKSLNEGAMTFRFSTGNLALEEIWQQWIIDLDKR